MKIKIPFKEVVLSILSVKNQLYNKFKDEEEYRLLINYLMTEDFYGDEDLKLPTAKSIEEATGLNNYQVRKKLKKLYDSIFDYENQLILDFNRIEYRCFVRENNTSCGFRMKNLNHLPKVGDDLDLPFLRGKFNTDYFYVDSVRHEFYESKQIVYLNILSGFFNPYWKIRKAEAEMKREFSFNDKYDLSEFELKRKLGLW
jgi:hypothetical protein